MNEYPKRPYYKPVRIEHRTSIIECVLAVIGALFMAAVFIAAVLAVGK